jgi:hypothetical protein
MLSFGLLEPTRVTLTILDSNGRRVSAFDAGDFPSGTSTITIPAEQLASGTYFVRLNAGRRHAMKAFFVVR